MNVLVDKNIKVINISHAIDCIHTDIESDAELQAEQMYAYAIDHAIDYIVTDNLDIFKILKKTGIHVYYLTPY